MKPWIVDAKDIEFSSDVHDFTGKLFHTTNTIDRFLDRSNSSELLVAAPKGFGKTLLLKAKRISVNGSGVACLPENSLVDKPIGTPRIFSKQDITTIMASTDYWTSIWLISLTVSIAKHVKILPTLKFNSEQLNEIKEDDNYKSVCDVFGIILSLSRRNYYIAYEDMGRVLVPSFRNIHKSIYVFIDNVDEYFESHLGMDQENSPLSGVLEKKFWYSAQIGLATAARQLQGINSHIKICASIRKEVLPLMLATETGLQLIGGMLDVTYQKEDLIDILNRNIDAEDDNNLVSPSSEDHFERFVGRRARYLKHLSTGEEELFEDFLIRHTLWRPRDLALLGRDVSSTPKERRSEKNIRERIIRSTVFIAKSYIAESKPHLHSVDEHIIIALLNKNVLSADEIKAISTQYDDLYNRANGTNLKCHIFCQLYKIGLIGHLSISSNLKEMTQSFLLPGEGPPEQTNILPNSEIYLVHPVLDSFIASLNSEYISNMNTLNVIGRGRIWRSESDYSFVLKGDVAGFSEIMSDPELSIRFGDIFKDIVSSATRTLVIGEIDGGDSVLLIDKNPINILNAARAICRGLYQSPINKKLRFGGSLGLVSINADKQVHGRTIRTAARIEPFAKVGTILIDGNFYNALTGVNTEMEFVKANTNSHPTIPAVDDLFDVGKNESDLKTHVELYEFDCTRREAITSVDV